jgi:scyllo-inositol 2-dehydrogenase (NADP+)
MATREPIKVGIVGLGRAGGRMHTRELKERTKKFKVVAACDLREECRVMAAEAFGCRTYSKIEDLIADPDVELVDIATRSPDHVKHALQALKNGKRVFLEKPIATSYTEAKRLQRAVKGKRGRLFFRHNRRFEPGFQHVREIIASGILGDVYEIKLRRHGYTRRGDWQAIKRCGGGQLLNWGPHVVDHALRFLDGKVDSVWSDLRKIATVGDAEDHVHIILKGGGRKKMVVDLEISGGAAKCEPTYLVLGTRGALRSEGDTISLRYIHPRSKLKDRKADPGDPPVSAGFGAAEKLKWVVKDIPVAPKTKCNCRQIWDHLYESIRNRKRFPIGMDEALQVMEVLSEARKGTPFEFKDGK